MAVRFDPDLSNLEAKVFCFVLFPPNALLNTSHPLPSFKIASPVER